MLSYDRQTKPGLVALYDIRPGNGVGPFLQPRSPHGALPRTCYYMIFSVLLTAVNICVLTMCGRLRWLWLSGSPPLTFLLCVLLFVESVMVNKILLLHAT